MKIICKKGRVTSPQAVRTSSPAGIEIGHHAPVHLIWPPWPYAL